MAFEVRNGALAAEETPKTPAPKPVKKETTDKEGDA